MNRTGLVIALGLSLVIGLLFGIFPELDLKLAALFYDSASASFPLKQNGLAAFARDAAMWIAWALALPALIAIVGKLVRPDRPMLVPGRAAVFLAGHRPALGRRADQSHLQEPLGAAAAGGGDRVQRPLALRAVVGSARRVRAQLLVLLRRGRHRVLDLCARGADPAGVAASGLCGGDRVRGRNLRAADGVRRAFFYRRRRRGPRQLFRDLAGLCLDLPLAIDPGFGRAGRSGAGALGPARIPAAGSAGAGARRLSPVLLSAIKRVPIPAKFVIRARSKAARTASAISTDWKLHEYDSEKPAQGRKSRHRFFGRSRHLSRAALDEAEGRARLCLYRQSRPARRGRLRRDSAQGAGVRRRKGPAGGLPHATGPRRHRRHPVRRLPRLDRRHRLFQHHAARPRGDRHDAGRGHEGRRRQHLGRWLDLQGQRYRAVLPLRPADQSELADLQALARPAVHRRTGRPRGNVGVHDRQWLRLQDECRKGLLDRQQSARRHPRGQGSRASRQRHQDRQSDHGRAVLARRLCRQGRKGRRAF